MIYLDNNTKQQKVYIPRYESVIPTGSTGHSATLQTKNYTITENGTTAIHPDLGYDGISGGTIDVNVPATSGVTLVHLNVDDNGEYQATGNTAYSGVTVNVPQGYTQEEVELMRELAYNDGYSKGYQDGVESVISGETYVNVNPKQIQAVSGASTSTINITSNSAWTITAPQWVTLSAAFGTGDTSVTVTFNQNTGITRNGVITVTDTTTQHTDNVVVIQNGESDGDYSKQVFTIEVISSENNGYIDLNFEDKDVYMSVNDSQYVKIDSTNKRVYVAVGDTIKLKGDNTTLNAINDRRFVSHWVKFNVYGNIMSLFNSQNFDSVYEFEAGSDCNLRYFFYFSSVVDASNLILPVTALTNNCYQYMFNYAWDLISAPALPAKTLTSHCYDSMFTGCQSLINAPELPAETVPNYGYFFMFNLCRSLSHVKCLAKNLGSNATRYWLKNVSQSGTFVKASGSTWETSVDGIPDGWTVIEQ